jgi:hypothetical protein
VDNALATPETVSGSPREKTGQIKYQMFWCFLLLAGVSLCVGIVLMFEPSRGLAWGGNIHGEEASLSYAALRWRIALGIGLVISTHALVFLFLVRRIANPLAKSALAAQRMADGHLGATLPTAVPNEIGCLGEHINGLAVNFQEVLTLVWNQSEAAITRLRRTTRPAQEDKGGSLPSGMMAELAAAQHELETLRMMVRSFDLYDVAITANDHLAAKEESEKAH